MKSVCEHGDENLVMLVHGELKGWSRVRAEAHLFLCPTCRSKEQRLRALANTLAVSLSNPSLGARTFARPKTALWASLGVGAVSIMLLGWNYSEGQISASAATSAASSTLDHCVKSRPPIPPPVPKAAVLKPPVSASAHDCER